MNKQVNIHINGDFDSALDEAQQDAMRARATYARMESEAGLIRELGGMMGVAFREAFANARNSVNMAELKVRRMLEKKHA